MSRWTRFLPPGAAAAVALAAGPAAGQELPPYAPPLPAVAPAALPVAADPAPPAADDGCDPCRPFDFKKVPPVRPFPRPGYFSIPPAGPGYYSALDLLTGTCREKPPTFGYPPFGLMGPGFFDADWRYLDDPKTPPQDVFERLKRVRLGDDWLFATGGSSWTRYMSEYNSRLTQRDNVYDLARTRVYGDLWYRDAFRFYVEGIYADSYWQDLPPLPIDRNRGDFQNLFVDAKLGDLGGAPVYARVGRQELLFGSQRLVSPLDWANTRRTFQGVRFLRGTEKLDLDLFWVRPVIPNANDLDTWDTNQEFVGAWAAYKPRKGTFLDFYYLYLNNTNAVVQQGIRRSPFDRHTFGTRYAGDVGGTYLWDVEAAMQLGRQAGASVVAGMFTAGAGYHWKDAPLNPTAWLYYDYASGDRDPGAGTVNTFHQLFPFGHWYLGWADQVGRQNVHDLSAHLWLYPQPWASVWLQYHVFALDQARDALYNAAGNVVRRDPTGRAGRFVGQELDVVLNFHLTRRADLLTGYSHLWGGNFLRNTSGPNAAADTSLYFLQYGYRW